MNLGAFNTFLNTYALTYNASGLEGATSPSVTTTDSQLSDDDSNSSDGNKKESDWSLGVIIGEL